MGVGDVTGAVRKALRQESQNIQSTQNPKSEGTVSNLAGEGTTAPLNKEAGVAYAHTSIELLVYLRTRRESSLENFCLYYTTYRLWFPSLVRYLTAYISWFATLPILLGRWKDCVMKKASPMYTSGLGTTKWIRDILLEEHPDLFKAQ